MSVISHAGKSSRLDKKCGYNHRMWETMVEGRGVLDIPLDLFSGERYVQCLDILV